MQKSSSTEYKQPTQPPASIMAELGSETWPKVEDASDYDEDDELQARATKFIADINWDNLTAIASHIRGVDCKLSENYSCGHYNLVRKLTYADGVSWIARLRLPDLPSVFGSREAMKAADCMRIEIATMNYLRLHSSIPVPEVFGQDLSADNPVGAPYMFMSYIHGTTATDLQEAKGCKPGVFGSPAQDRRFRRQMAEYQVQLASLTFDKIGSLHQEGDHFTIGPEIETGEGPWDTPQEYYAAIVRHRMKVAESDAEPEVRERASFSYPGKFLELMQAFERQPTGPYSLVNRDFGAHNMLVDSDWTIVAMIDFDGVLAAPSAAVAQLPIFLDLLRPIPGHVETRPLALAYQKDAAHLLPEYVDMIRSVEAGPERKNSTDGNGNGNGNGTVLDLADLLMSDGALVAQGLDEFGQHRDFVNDRWARAYDLLWQKQQQQKRCKATYEPAIEAPYHFTDDETRDDFHIGPMW